MGNSQLKYYRLGSIFICLAPVLLPEFLIQKEINFIIWQQTNTNDIWIKGQDLNVKVMLEKRADVKRIDDALTIGVK